MRPLLLLLAILGLFQPMVAEARSFSCKTNADNSAIYFVVSNDSDQSYTCNFLCVVGDLKTRKESVRLECKDVHISAHAPKAAYCRRNLGEAVEDLGSLLELKSDCN